jgi:oligoribonuclease NrnB/cAMP/cGMP phosphodiesterase (DHH superfamily)
MSDRPLVLFHADCPDGFCAAWCAWRKFGEGADYLPVRYGDSPPDVVGRPAVYVLDFCYPHQALQEMAAAAGHVCVLDHHRSRAADMAGRYYEPGDEEKEFTSGHGKLVCRYHPDKSGGRLAWERFHGGAPAPWLVDYTEDRDLWRWKLPRSREVSAALASYPFDFRQWDLWGSQRGPQPGSYESPGEFYLRHMMNDGDAILRYQTRLVESQCKHAAEVELAGHKVLAVNATCLVSEIAGKLAEGRPFGATFFVRAGGKKVWSLRSREGGVDVSEIARSLGGGGHRNAAGFEEER